MWMHMQEYVSAYFKSSKMPFFVCHLLRALVYLIFPVLFHLGGWFNVHLFFASHITDSFALKLMLKLENAFDFNLALGGNITT